MGLFRKIRDRLKKGVRDVASGAKDNPALAIAAMFGIPALMGGAGGGGGGSGFMDFMGKILGQTAQTGAAGQSRSGSGILVGIMIRNHDLDS